MNAFDLGKEIKTKNLTFKLTIPTYANLRGKAIGFNINDIQWNEVKFLNEEGKLHEDMNTIPNNTGGIYTFIIKSDVLPEIAAYLVYVGRAQYSGTSQNLKKRCRSYLKDKRLGIDTMRRTWGQHLYIRYTALNDNELIRDLEDYLIESLLPVYNSAIRDPIIKAAVKSFDR